ncbi:MAG: hypothetical protein ACPHLK_06915 [Gammaproteobacteria bacterium]|jgi:hypothetical protein
MIDFRALQKKGWLEIKGLRSPDDLAEIANQLGQIRPHPNGEYIFNLRPSNGSNSTRGTFSNVYGYAEFPLHTDLAFWLLPARYVVLGMINKSDSYTNVILTTDVFSELGKDVTNYARDSIYIIDTIEGKKYSSLFFRSQSLTGFKFDSNCMKPVNGHAKLFHNKITACLNDIETTSIHWTGNKAVVIDNWNTLHGRGRVNASDKNRNLMRVYTG